MNLCKSIFLFLLIIALEIHTSSIHRNMQVLRMMLKDLGIPQSQVDVIGNRLIKNFDGTPIYIKIGDTVLLMNKDDEQILYSLVSYAYYNHLRFNNPARDEYQRRR